MLKGGPRPINRVTSRAALALYNIRQGTAITSPRPALQAARTRLKKRCGKSGQNLFQRSS